LKFLFRYHFRHHCPNDAHFDVSATCLLDIEGHLPLPLQAPAKALTVIAIGNEVEIPHIKLVIIVAVNPSRIVGFRPK